MANFNPSVLKGDNPQALQSALAKAEAVRTVLAAIAAKHGAGAVLASSLSAEDMVLTDLIARDRLPIGIFTLDTGRLPAETYDLLAETAKHYPNTPVSVIFPEAADVQTFVVRFGINGFYDSVEARKACCGARKVAPLNRALTGKAAWITGMRAAQSATRAELPVEDFDSDRGIPKYNPLSDWSEAEVWAYVRHFQVPYNALHDRFYPSIGCAPCTRSITPGEDVRAGRWWWENPESKECGLHVKQA